MQNLIFYFTKKHAQYDQYFFGPVPLLRKTAVASQNIKNDIFLANQHPQQLLRRG